MDSSSIIKSSWILNLKKINSFTYTLMIVKIVKMRNHVILCIQNYVMDFRKFGFVLRSFRTNYVILFLWMTV